MKLADARKLMEKHGIPGTDAYDLPTSAKRFPDGAWYRMEISGIERPNVLEATIEGAAARFRPVLMTTLSTVLGILPIALALGAGSESRVPMGVAIIGGLLFGTGLTLYVVPAVYTYLTREITAQERALHAGKQIVADPIP